MSVSAVFTPVLLCRLVVSMLLRTIAFPLCLHVPCFARSRSETLAQTRVRRPWRTQVKVVGPSDNSLGFGGEVLQCDGGWLWCGPLCELMGVS